MSRFPLIVAGLILLGGAILYGLWPHPVITSASPEMHQTRGLASQETPDALALRLAMEKQSRESSLSPLAILQAGVTFNGEIPLWGILSGVLIGVGAFAALKMQLSNHEKTDIERFAATNARFTSTDDMLAEIRGDVKRLLSHAGKDD